MECDAGGRVVLGAASCDDDIRARVTADRPGALVIRQSWFPGWEITIDGRVVTSDMLAANRRADGLIRLVTDEPGEHVIRATYTGPPGGGAGAVCMLAAGAAILALLRRVDRGRGSRAASSVGQERGVS